MKNLERQRSQVGRTFKTYGGPHKDTGGRATLEEEIGTTRLGRQRNIKGGLRAKKTRSYNQLNPKPRKKRENNHKRTMRRELGEETEKLSAKTKHKSYLGGKMPKSWEDSRDSHEPIGFHKQKKKSYKIEVCSKKGQQKELIYSEKGGSPKPLRPAKALRYIGQRTEKKNSGLKKRAIGYGPRGFCDNS